MDIAVSVECHLYLSLAIYEMHITWCWSGGRGILIKLSLCCSIVYNYNGAQRYDQFLQASRLYWALSLIDLTLYHLCLQSSSCYTHSKLFWLHFSLLFSDLSVVGLALKMVEFIQPQP